MVNAPLVMPEIITGITQLLLFVSMLHLGWPHRGSPPSVDCAYRILHRLLTVTVQSRLARGSVSGEAAMDLGSGPVRAFIGYHPADDRAGIGLELAAQALRLSLDDLVISSFVSGPGAEHAAHR